MIKNSSLFWTDSILFVVLMVTAVTGITGIFAQTSFHVFLGISLWFGALLHLGLHWSWIKNSIQRYDRLSKSVRGNVWLNLGLFFTYILAVSVGLSARAMQIPFHRHVFLGIIHVILAVLILVFQGIHILRHWKWITAMAHKFRGIPNRVMKP